MEKKTLVVDRTSLTDVEVRKERIDPDSLENGQVLFQVDQFSFTANNITYALMGEALGYWKFFPVEESKGVIPVWGFGQVVASNCDGVKVGERFYGYYPFSTHLIVKPARMGSTGFFDGEAHRIMLPAIYNQYLSCSTDPLYQVETEAIQMLLRPLFTTSFLLEDFLGDNDYFGSDAVTITSASSKTAIGLAFMLAMKRKDNRSLSITGLTSEHNLEFTRQLGCYDQVYTYEQLGELDSTHSHTLVDFAGDSDLISKLHQHLSQNIKYSCMVGAAHGAQMSLTPSGLPGPAPVLFFAPSQAGKRWSEWGKHVFEQRLKESWALFTQFVSGWLEIQKVCGESQVKQKYIDVLSGKIPPNMGLILSLVNE